MTARTGMVPLITELRVKTNSGTADYTVQGTNYFTDDQLQAYLDRTRLITRMDSMTPIPLRVAGGTTQWYDYQIDAGLGVWFEQDMGDGTSGWAIKDGYGNTVANGSFYTVNYDAMLVTFAADTKGAAYQVDARTYDLFAAAAMVWREKAALESLTVDFSIDNHAVKASQRRDYCITQAEYFESQSGVSGVGGLQTGNFSRTDENLLEPNYSPTGGQFAFIPGTNLPPSGPGGSQGEG